MVRERCFCILLLMLLHQFVVAQPLPAREYSMSVPSMFVDSIHLRPHWSTELSRAVTVPLLFVGVGVYTATDNEWFDRYEIKEERDEVMPHFHTHADDYLQFAPIAAVYGLNAIGVKGKNDFANRTVLLLKSEILVGVLTYSLKTITAVPRPDSGAPTSMPSGHTAQAFAAATFMAKEYGDRSVWYSVGAYTIATGVGVMRVLNNRHWVSDVLVGAGVGIFSTNIAYLTHQYKWGNGKHRSGNTAVIPAFGGRAYTLSFIHRFG
jgi:membrane-associated phospholipid phosphatase